MTDTKELAPQESGAQNMSQLPAAPSPLAAILANPASLTDVPLATVQGLWAIQREMDAEAAKRLFDAAKIKVQSRMSPVLKDARNDHTRSDYARMESVIRMLSPLLSDEGFSWGIDCAEPRIEGYMTVRLTLTHEGGHTERSYMDAPADTGGPKGGGSKTPLHGSASTVNFCGRHLLCGVWGVVLTKDTDGITAPVETITEQQAADLQAVVTEVGADEVRFLRWAGAGDGGYEAIPAHRLAEAHSLLAKKGAPV